MSRQETISFVSFGEETLLMREDGVAENIPTEDLQEYIKNNNFKLNTFKGLTN